MHSHPLPVLHSWEVRPQALLWGHRVLAQLSQILLLPSPAQEAGHDSSYCHCVLMLWHVKGHLGHMAQSA